MDYFMIKQDGRFNYTPILLNVSQKIDKGWIRKEEQYKIPEIVSFHLKEQMAIQYPDFMDRQLTIISKAMKKVVSMYEPDLCLKTISLIEAKKGINMIYYLPIFERVDCIHKDCIDSRKLIMQHMILDQDKLPECSIFQLATDQKNILIVRLDLLESMLRRNMKGITFERIELR